MEHSWIPSGLYDEHCVHKFPCVGSGWAGVHLNTTGQSRSTSPLVTDFMNCWLLVGRRWCNRRQRLLVLDMCTCHTKSQWVTVTLTDSWVYQQAAVRTCVSSCIAKSKEWMNEWMNEWIKSYIAHVSSWKLYRALNIRERKNENNQLLHDVTKRLSKQVTFQRPSKRGQGLLQTDLALSLLTDPECWSCSCKTPGTKVIKSVLFANQKLLCARA